MSRRSKLAVALSLALAAHALLLWRPAPLPTSKPGEDSAEPGSEVIAVDWVAGPESPVTATPVPTVADPAATITERDPLAQRRQPPSPVAAGPAGPAPRDYGDRVRRHLSRFAGDLPGTESGEARVRFTVGIDGAVSDVELLRSSGDPQLDEAALALPEQSAPLPSPGAAPVRLEVPVRASAS